MAAAKNTPTMQQLLRYWYTSLPAEKVAKELGISRTLLYRLGKRYKLPKREADKKVKRVSKIEYDPTPEEIAIAAQDIRETWSETENDRRYIGAKRKEWTPPQFEYSSRTGAFISKSL